MKRFIKNILIAGIVGVFLNSPFFIGELLTQNALSPRSEFPVSVFVALWIEITILAYICISVFNAYKQGLQKNNVVSLVIQLVILGIFAWAWMAMIIDQWPCFFLGGSGC